MVNSYDFFAALEHPEIVIVDIDAGFTNNIHLPCVPDENMYIRILNVRLAHLNLNSLLDVEECKDKLIW